MGDLKIRQATSNDLQTICDIYSGIATWLHDVKNITNQWERELPKGLAQKWINTGDQYLFSEQNETAGAVRVTTQDDHLWTNREGTAYYIHSLAVIRKFSGRGLGLRVLTYFEQKARNKQLEYIRLDCMASNEYLKQYYIEAGYTSLGQRPNKRAFWLFEKQIV